ncbi:hypothetical protein ACW9H6_20230 [Pseudomonas sp. SDO528_S397]
MNSALLLALNAVALAALVMFHFQSSGEDVAQLRQPVPHHLQQRPQLALMTPDAKLSVHLPQQAQRVPSAEHWVF